MLNRSHLIRTVGKKTVVEDLPHPTEVSRDRYSQLARHLGDAQGDAFLLKTDIAAQRSTDYRDLHQKLSEEQSSLLATLPLNEMEILGNLADIESQWAERHAQTLELREARRPLVEPLVLRLQSPFKAREQHLKTRLEEVKTELQTVRPAVKHQEQVACERMTELGVPFEEPYSEKILGAAMVLPMYGEHVVPQQKFAAVKGFGLKALQVTLTLCATGYSTLALMHHFGGNVGLVIGDLLDGQSPDPVLWEPLVLSVCFGILTSFAISRVFDLLGKHLGATFILEYTGLNREKRIQKLPRYFTVGVGISAVMLVLFVWLDANLIYSGLLAGEIQQAQPDLGAQWGGAPSGQTGMGGSFLLLLSLLPMLSLCCLYLFGGLQQGARDALLKLQKESRDLDLKRWRENPLVVHALQAVGQLLSLRGQLQKLEGDEKALLGDLEQVQKDLLQAADPEKLLDERLAPELSRLERLARERQHLESRLAEVRVAPALHREESAFELQEAYLTAVAAEQEIMGFVDALAAGRPQGRSSQTPAAKGQQGARKPFWQRISQFFRVLFPVRSKVVKP